MDSLNLWGGSKGNSTGWKQAARVNCIVLASMSAALVGCLIAATTKVGIHQALFFYEGGCDGGSVSQINTVLHLLINVTSTLVVTSSNFFMQVLNSPSREELNKAHFSGSWMGIGVPSVRNAFMVSRFKSLCWTCLFLSSIPIHLLFNSMLFQTDHRESDFHLTIATEHFVNGGQYYPPGAALVQAVNLTDYADENSVVMRNISDIALNASRWEKLDIHTCKEEYINCNGLKLHRNVVLVVDKPAGYLGLDVNWEYPFFDKDVAIHVNNNVNDTYNPVVNITSADNNTAYTSESVETVTDSVPTYGLRPGSYNVSVKYCLAEPIERVCQIALSPTLLLAVTLCVIIKTCTAIVVTLVLSHRNQAPLVTLGDAIESFIEKSDPVTAGMSTISQAEIQRAMKHDKAFLLPVPRQWQTSRRRRAAVVPLSVWATSYLLFAIGISICAYFLNGLSSSGAITGFFFESDQNAFLNFSFTFFDGVLLANSPQLLLSFCYLAYNNLFTRLQMAREWSLFSQGYQSLRVTDPKGDQYSTYRLQLPYKYSVPLIGLSILLHWLLSNTIYLFVSTGGYFGTDYFHQPTQPDTSLPLNTAVAVGYSGYSLLALLVVSCVLVLIPIALSLKKLPSHNIIGSNSLALSAACHVSRLSCAFEAPADSLFDALPTSPQCDLAATPMSPEAYRDPSFEMHHLTIPSPTPTLHRASQQSLTSSERRLLDCDRGSEDGSGGGSEAEGKLRQQHNSPFTKLARSRIRWGVVRMPPEWHAEYDHEDGPVEHLGFGVEDDGVEPPVPGRWYA
ncbi:hypothetical protein GGR54DRAFT_629151 [Hypoxylon sp. NC1633]|nr:hypothetical protein GGR54DRAFT_629151 [Hypoxylon sp. NC1633]